MYSVPPTERLLEKREELIENFKRDAIRMRNRLIELDEDIGIESKILKKSCLQCNPPEDAHIYYLETNHYLDGNSLNELYSNKAIICPCCEAHILLPALSPEDIWKYKSVGMRNATIARILGISRQRVGALLKAYQKTYKPPAATELDLDKRIKEIQAQERTEIHIMKEDAPTVSKKRVTDRRTWRKSLLKEMKKQGIKLKGVDK